MKQYYLKKHTHNSKCSFPILFPLLTGAVPSWQSENCLKFFPGEWNHSCMVWWFSLFILIERGLVQACRQVVEIGCVKDWYRFIAKSLTWRRKEENICLPEQMRVLINWSVCNELLLSLHGTDACNMSKPGWILLPPQHSCCSQCLPQQCLVLFSEWCFATAACPGVCEHHSLCA